MVKRTRCWYIILIILAAIYLYFFYFNSKKVKENQESFTPKIREAYRPHLRKMRLHYENFTDNYGQDFIINKLKRFNLY